MREFSSIVNDEIRDNASNQEKLFLREFSNLEDWQYELLDIKLSLEKQLAGYKAEKAHAKYELYKDDYLEFLSRKEAWRAGLIRVMTTVERRLAEIKRLNKRNNGHC